TSRRPDDSGMVSRKVFMKLPVTSHPKSASNGRGSYVFHHYRNPSSEGHSGQQGSPLENDSPA
ncbi:hypothetical protein K2Y11_20395, partial [bacterium]|nr:hypothetical protein [bacterium]